MRAKTVLLFLLPFVLPFVTQGAIVYSNVTTSLSASVLYASGPYLELGDSITLGGTERQADSATVEFFNAGQAGGTFDASLRFYDVGSPVGSQIGSTATVTGISIGALGIADVSFSSLNLTLPDNVIFTVAIANASNGLNVGMDLFDAPTVGSSSNQTIITRDGSGFAQTGAGNIGNFYFLLDAVNASDVPEPNPGWLMLLPLAGMAWRCRRAR